MRECASSIRKYIVFCGKHFIDDNAEKKEMFFYIKGTEPTTNNETKDLEAVFKEEQKSKLEE